MQSKVTLQINLVPELVQLKSFIVAYKLLNKKNKMNNRIAINVIYIKILIYSNKYNVCINN